MKLIDKTDIKFLAVYWLIMAVLCLAAWHFDIRL